MGRSHEPSRYIDAGNASRICNCWKGHYAIGEIQGSESVDITDKLTKFAELVTKHERESLSALCIGLMTEETTDAEDRMVVRMVKKIRNRKDNHEQ
jgi:hypothetical protein